MLVQPEVGSVKAGMSLPVQGFLLLLQSHLLPPGLIPGLISPRVRKGGVVSPVPWLCFGTGSCSSLGTGGAQAQTPKIHPSAMPRLGLCSTSSGAGAAGNLLQVSLGERLRVEQLAGMGRDLGSQEPLR